MSTRRRGLTAADHALWQAYTARAAIAPLPGKELAPPPPAPPALAAAPAPAPAPPPPAPPRHAPRPAPELHVGAAPAGLDAKRWKALRRGTMRPERTLDLHGRRAQEAHGAVRRFLFTAHAEGLRCVAIVTGKGSSLEGGVLRRELPHWLNAPELRALLLGAAHPHATNPGAVHLLLRRPRGP
ncbi:Smr/MutS family protein [Siccirubricoccus sp. KC 17139]|uniref:Smr/MutS family protein n=1 Tax=Siccirubricoccus soli TaxID=2899147 RepID=A0ABT1D1U6_9PROT|nr:Smr/MutS family protein [Siccirubricoccus soli]MCO6415285.1 Smr/MutS family protein [Siccirubricoccus soli]MCP2681416.1 Smr/MutS family protein [Siccirubricoccus soli]